MATLLHIDSSVFPASASASRAVARTFRQAWEEQHPEGTVIHRDLATEPVPHLTAESHLAAVTDPAEHTPEQAAALARRLLLIEEIERADALLIGAPMYNFTIPSTLKAWLDNVILVGRTAGDAPSAKGTPPSPWSPAAAAPTPPARPARATSTCRTTCARCSGT